MIKIEDIRNLKLNITWRIIYIALNEEMISTDDVIAYAADLLEHGDVRIEVCELAGADSSDSEYIADKLFELMEDENSDSDLEERKIRALIVNEHLKEKNSNYINGLVELTELWAELGYPDDSPHVIQGIGNNITPLEYYTQSNYDNLYMKNIKWLENELQYLRRD